MAGDFLSQDEVDALRKGVTGTSDDRTEDRKLARKQAQLMAQHAKLKAELAAMRKKIAETRQYGVVSVIGTSSTEQLEQVFSSEDVDAIRANLSNKLILRVVSAEQSEELAQVLDANPAAEDDFRANLKTKFVFSAKRTKGDRVRFEAVLPPNVLAALDAYAEKNGWSRSKTLALAVPKLPGIEIEGKHETVVTLQDALATNALYMGQMGEGMSRGWKIFDEITPTGQRQDTGKVEYFHPQLTVGKARELLIDAIQGNSLEDVEFARQMAAKRLAVAYGAKSDTCYRWSEMALQMLPLEKLEALYAEIKAAKA